MDSNYLKDVLTIQQGVYELLTNEEDLNKKLPLTELSVKQVFEFVDKYFDKFLMNSITIGNILPLLHYALKMESISKASETIDLNATVCELLNKHKDVEAELIIVVQLIYEIINTIDATSTTASALRIDRQVFKDLVDVLFGRDQNEHEQLCANLLTCIKLYCRKFNAPDVIEKLWHTIGQQNVEHKISPCVIQTLLQLFDEFQLLLDDQFYKSSHLMAIIEKLLVAEERVERKSAYFLLKKVAESISTRNMKNLDLQWTSTYITIMENLEENQSHLILPSLEALKSINITSHVSSSTWWGILMQKILAHNNILVIRWAILYIMEQNSATINPQVLSELLETLNTTRLYNVEESTIFLQASHVSTFLRNHCHGVVFLKLFANINWKSVPLHFWLSALKKNDIHFGSVTKELLLMLAARVRVLQNPTIRYATIKLYENIFSKEIDNLPFSDYLILIETLYNIMDPYDGYHIFIDKLTNYNSSIEGIPTFSQRFYEIFTNNIVDEKSNNNLTENILPFLSNFPRDQHGWLRFMIVFDLKDHKAMINDFCQTNYDVDLDMLTNSTSTLQEITEYFDQRLVWHKNETSFVREKSMEFFVRHQLFNADTDISSRSAIVRDILDTDCTDKVLEKLSELMLHNKILESDFDCFVQALKRLPIHNSRSYNIILNILKYYETRLQAGPTDDFNNTGYVEYGEEILNIDPDNSYICSAVLQSKMPLRKETHIRGVLYGDSKSGDARIEDMYIICTLKIENESFKIRKLYIEHNPIEIADDLLIRNNELSKKRPRYFENSAEHRLKLRIAGALIKLMPWFGSESELWLLLWQPLLEENNQLNITYAYELLIGLRTPYTSLFEKLQKISTYTPSQQVSIISTIHCYCILNWDTITDYSDRLPQIVHTLLPLTMGANFQTRLYAQLVIYSLLEKLHNESMNSSTLHILKVMELLPCTIELLVAIRATLGDKLNDLKNDLRLRLPYLYLENREDFYDIIMYLTNAPIDEYPSLKGYSKCNSLKYSSRRIKEQQTAAINFTMNTNVAADVVNNVQRKMNPSSELLKANNLLLYPIRCMDNEMYVIASLIDKLPNLGGIARTCDVLGIRNLVVASKSVTEKTEFKNLSMTAEKELNILEIKPSSLVDFLMRKRMEGFKIVGAEQTATSSSFVDFKFPNKCILLLGHEKEGIPANLLGFLDYAVEIPQFGIVRSLNVHVTGALFMWEYCKQYIVKN